MKNVGLYTDSCFSILVQAALAICNLGIRGFDYLQTQKPPITKENYYCLPNLALYRRKIPVLVFTDG